MNRDGRREPAEEKKHDSCHWISLYALRTTCRTLCCCNEAKPVKDRLQSQSTIGF
ncbi:Uncharacterized protein APZ42_032491 [Daphnia magna]|uniref:Uncharacterized protein n=1 Tax=Daphnia magna TaxID=35525 RepID=A0A164LLG9_9CRUS|nr:Uncharacterized protein APZ42_032491 [Daphnia magna]